MENPGLTNRRIVGAGGADFYPTPAWATHALIENETFEGEIWEPACGNGAMSKVLALAAPVRSTDFYDRGFGDGRVNFTMAREEADNIVTNPPYNLAETFVRVGTRLARKKFALLMRLAFLEGAGRANSIFLVNPPARVWVFSERITFYPAGAERQGSGTTAYAWFVWDRASPGGTELKWFRPGYKARFG